MFGFFRRFRRDIHQTPSVHIVLYTRRGCHLCDDALACLRTELREIPHSLDVLDIDMNPEWRTLYTDCVPVVVIDGKVRFRGNVNPVLLRRVLRASG